MINLLVIFLFLVFIIKYILHFIYLKKNLKYVRSNRVGALSVKIDNLFNIYRLLFLASIMFPIIRKGSDSKQKLIINILVFTFYINVVLIFVALR